MDPREISYVTGLPLYIFTQKQTRDALGMPYRRFHKLIRFDRDEVMAWAQRWSQNTKDLGIDVKAAPRDQYRSLQQTLASLQV
jgi:predicted transcriptional regulator